MNRYVDFERLGNGDLCIRLTDDGKEELNDLLERGDVSHDDVFIGLLEHQLCNGWEIVPPEDIGALTSSLILSDDVSRDDDGKLLEIGEVWWFPNYQIVSEIDSLKETGYVIYRSGSNS